VTSKGYDCTPVNEEGEQELYASGLPAELGTDDDGKDGGTDKPKVGLGTNVQLMFYSLLWAFSSADAAAQVYTLPCSSRWLRVVDMPSPPACTGLSRTYL